MQLKNKKHEIAVFIIFGLMIVGTSFFYNNGITGYATFNTEGKQPWKGGSTLVTHYYITKEDQMDVWSVTNDPKLGSTAACNVKYDEGEWGFYEEVKCQGTGFSADGQCKYRYFDIQTTKENSPCHPLGDSFIPTTHRTIAAPTDLDKGTEVYVYFGPEYTEWNGCYVVEDRGSAITGNHIDLFVGAGKEALDSTNYLPRRANIYVGCDGIKPISPGEEIYTDIDIEVPEDSSGSYEFTPKFEAKTEFDLYYYETTITQAKKLVEDMKECELSRETGETYTEEETKYNALTGEYEEYEILYKEQEIDLMRCLDLNIPENWKLDCESKDLDYDDETFMFCVPLPYTLKIYNEETNKVEEIVPSIKFAIEFERKPLEAISNECEGTKGG